MSFNQPRCRWLIGVVFFTSLAANVFLAGWVFGDGGFTRPTPPRGMFFESFDEKAKQLAEPQRSAVIAVLDEYQPQLQKRMKRVMQAREQVDSLLKSENYNREDAAEAFDKLQERSFDAQELAQDMMLDIADALPPKERAGFLERPKDRRGRGAEFKPKAKSSAPKAAAKAPETPVAATPEPDANTTEAPQNN